MADSSKEGDEQPHNSEGSFLDNGESSSPSVPSVKIFQGLYPAGKPHLLAAKSETRFAHVTNGSLYCSRLERLQKRLGVSTELKITQECLKRFTAAMNFAKKLETFAEHEISRLNDIHRQELSKNRRLALEHYYKLCKEAKIHLNHWQHLVCKTKRQAKCFGQFLAMHQRIQKFKQGFMSLRSQVLFWLGKIASAGLRIMANASFKQLSSTADLQNFLQGIEEFNHMLSSDLQQSDHLCTDYRTREEDSCLRSFSKDPPYSLNIVEILATVSVERAKLLAKLTHEYFTYEAKAIELQDFLSTTRFSWSFEGHFSTSDLQQCTESVRYAKLQSVIKKYGEKEEEFINQLLSTASVCAFLHHENEIRRRTTEVCRRHLQLTACHCRSVQSRCFICQRSGSSIKAITDATEYFDQNESLPSSENINHDRRTLFMESRETKLKLQICSVYRDDVWKMFAREFYDSLQSLRWPYEIETPIGAVCCWSTAVLMGITQHLENLASTVHCLMIAVGQADKCKSTNIIDGIPSTKTTSLMVQACSVFQHFFSTASQWKEFKSDESTLTTSTGHTFSVQIEDVFDRFGIFLSYCIYWFTTKVKHFLASWTLPPFLLLSQYELGILMKSINTTLQLMENMYCQVGNVSNLGVMVKHHWDLMEKKAGHLQVIEVESWENFKQKFMAMASEFWKEMMPKDRVWKRSRNSGNPPSEPSSYVEHAIIQVLQPVIEGVSQLPLDLQNCILIQAVEIMMDTWSGHILNEGIKFSVIGAHQLQVDFNYVKLWLTSEASSLDTSIQSDLSVLHVFLQLNEAVRLLMIQPKKQKRISENGVEAELESYSSTLSGSSVLSGSSSYDGDPELLNNRLILNRDQWLNLRLKKGKPKVPMMIPACLKSAEQT